MPQITVDVLSVHPKPPWSIEDEGQARKLLREIVSLRSTCAGAEGTANTNLDIQQQTDENARYSLG
jgi:hypothetical protein